MALRLCNIAIAREDRYYYLAVVGEGSFGVAHQAVDLFLGAYQHQTARLFGNPRSASRNVLASASLGIFQISGSPC